MTRPPVTLDDKYDLSVETVFLSGTQATVRLLLMQHARDAAAGKRTAGYVTGYRGSPLGGLDQQMARAGKALAAADVLFQPAINEDLAATALWGAQQAEMRGNGRFDGVFGVWYGKGPGVDRSGDAFRHANLSGTSPWGGVIALMGDDHTCESSTTAHQSEYAFVDAMMPVLNPAGVQELLDYGLYGFALSRFAGIWAGVKCVKDTVESTASVDGRLDRVEIVRPDFEMPPGGLSIRPGFDALEQEARLHRHKIPAAEAFILANRLNRIVVSGGPAPRMGIVSMGKSWLDTLEALDILGLDEVALSRLGVRLVKIGCTWPLVGEDVRRLAEGLSRIVVVEEKRGLVEGQLKEILYGTANAPAIVGKKDENGDWLFPSNGALEANRIAVALGRRILEGTGDEALAARLAGAEAAVERLSRTEDVSGRRPYFCAGCPHNTSTKVPDGHVAYAGIGCHFMAQWMDRNTEGFTQMGGEGANWIGEAPFSTLPHVFQNIGDGTYNHSGYLAIRAAKAAGVNVTYKILYNDAVAMTGGQANDGGLTVYDIAAQVAAEGAQRIAVVTDEPDKYPVGAFPANATVHHRDALDAVSRELAAVPGLTVLLYDQTCAAEKRRRRKRGTFPDPDQRILINERVCEGCGDCGVQSNCVAIQPVETEFGRKRQIDQSSCNKDFSCLKGFCPSFVTVKGARPKAASRAVGPDDPRLAGLPAPDAPAIEGTYGVLVTGVGGTGVVTVGAILGMAAHIEGKGCGIIDMAGLAQKGGAVISHIKLADRPEDIATIRVGAGGAGALLACDIAVAGMAKVLAAIDPAKSVVVANLHEQLPGDFTRDVSFALPTRQVVKALAERTAEGRIAFLDATRLAERLFGDAIAANMMILGHAFQKGALPLSAEAIEEAIRLNGAAVSMNLAAFRWGRLSAVDPSVLAEAEGAAAPTLSWRRPSQSLEELVARRREDLLAYQDAAYARRFEERVAAVAAAEERVRPGSTALTEAVARNLYKLMAIKDEYEVARLYTDGAFAAQLAEAFESHGRIELNLAPPLLSPTDPATGRPRKRAFGPWILSVLPVLARMKRLRGTPLDLFGKTAERRLERRVRADYEAAVDEIAARLDADRFEAALALASYPDGIRGFGPVRAESIERTEPERLSALAAFRAEAPAPSLAAAE